MAAIGWTGTVYSSGTISSTSAIGSGWLDWTKKIGLPLTQSSVVSQMMLRLVPSDVSSTMELDVVYEVAWSVAGAGGIDLHAFTKVTSTNVVENVIIPGDESTGIMVSTTGSVPAPVPEYFRITWDITNNDGGCSFLLYGTVVVL